LFTCQIKRKNFAFLQQDRLIFHTVNKFVPYAEKAFGDRVISQYEPYQFLPVGRVKAVISALKTLKEGIQDVVSPLSLASI
jgi:hypothetical protein